MQITCHKPELPLNSDHLENFQELTSLVEGEGAHEWLGKCTRKM